MSTRKITYAAVIGAVYAALTILLAPISYGPIQFRISEALCILPFFFPYSTWGLFVGCIIANLASSYGIADIVFGSLATLLASLCTMSLGKTHRDGIGVKALACLPPVVSNGVIIGAVIAYSTASTKSAFFALFALSGLQVAIGEMAVMFIIGLPLMIVLPKTSVFRKLQAQYSLT